MGSVHFFSGPLPVRRCSGFSTTHVLEDRLANACADNLRLDLIDTLSFSFLKVWFNLKLQMLAECKCHVAKKFF